MPAWWSNRRFDFAEVCLLVTLVAVLTLALSAERFGRFSHLAFVTANEGTWLKERYGPSKHSRHEEEWIIRDYFQDKRGGVFVDVGANHYKSENNTFYLESVLGWSGLAIDPQSDFADGYRDHRPRTRFLAFFVSDISDASATFYEIKENSLVASANREFAERGGTSARNRVYRARETSVPTVRLTDLLDRAGLARVDLVSIDVELAEPKVLAGFEIKRFQPELVCIEAHPQVRQQVLDYFAANGYVLLGRYLRADLQNLYFAPMVLPAGAGMSVPGAGTSGAKPR